jgi:iron complex transport system permease protein
VFDQPASLSSTVSPTQIKLRRPALAFIWLSIAVIAVFLLALVFGSVTIPLDQIITVLMGGEAERASWTSIVMQFRLPRALTAIIAGAALGVSGLLMQTLFRNPLAAPDVLGINSGASLGVALVVLSTGVGSGQLLAGVGLGGDLSLAAAATLGAALTVAIILQLSQYLRSGTTLLIVGLMVGQFTFACVSLLLYFSIPERIQAYINWGFGSFGGVTWAQFPILGCGAAAGLLLSAIIIKPLNALLLGETYAESLGVHVRRLRLGIILAAALLTGAVTAFCGPIGFISIAAPHLCRNVMRSADHHVLLPGTALVGALVALTASIIAEAPGTRLTLPLNAVTALLGAPVVLAILLRRKETVSND